MEKYISSVSPKGQITIPAEVRVAFDIEPKDRVVFEIENDVIRIIPLRDQLRRLHGRLSAKHVSTNWKAVEASAHEEIAENAIQESRQSTNEQR